MMLTRSEFCRYFGALVVTAVLDSCSSPPTSPRTPATPLPILPTISPDSLEQSWNVAGQLVEASLARTLPMETFTQQNNISESALIDAVAKAKNSLVPTSLFGGPDSVDVKLVDEHVGTKQFGAARLYQSRLTSVRFNPETARTELTQVITYFDDVLNNSTLSALAKQMGIVHEAYHIGQRANVIPAAEKMVGVSIKDNTKAVVVKLQDILNKQNVQILAEATAYAAGYAGHYSGDDSVLTTTGFLYNGKIYSEYPQIETFRKLFPNQTSIPSDWRALPGWTTWLGYASQTLV